MTHFTQLGLSNSSDKGQNRPRSNEKQNGERRKTATLVGALIATALLGVFVFESGCSRESNKPATIAPPAQAVADQVLTPTVATPVTPANAGDSQPSAKTKSRQRKLSASTYTNAAYGISFRYPKYDSLKEGDEANLELENLAPLEMNFVQPGGASIGVVELPRKPYAGTDLNAAFFEVSVNPKLNSTECEQFAFPETEDPHSETVAPAKTKVGDTEFRSVEGFAGEDENQADVKFYHVYQNGNCYEFALGLETMAESTPDEITPNVKPVNRNEVFRQLNWILSTVKIEPTATQEKPLPEVAIHTASPAMEAH